MLKCSLSQARKVLLLCNLVTAGCLFQNTSEAFQSLTLNWNASKDQTVTGYNIYYGKSSGVFDHKISVGTATSATISGLVEGTTYFFVATASDAQGLESPPSGQISYTVPGTWLSITSTVNGSSRSVLIASSSLVQPAWTLQTSSNLRTWTTLSRGSNSMVQVTMPGPTAPSTYYRLTSP